MAGLILRIVAQGARRGHTRVILLGCVRGNSGGSQVDVVGQAREREAAADAADMFRFVNKAIDVDRMDLKFTDEEKAEHKRIADEFNRQTSREDAAIKNDLAVKAWLQQEAIKAIPTEELRAAALELDETPPPVHRPFPYFDTPPIANFNMADYDGSKAAKNEEDEDEE